MSFVPVMSYEFPSPLYGSFLSFIFSVLFSFCSLAQGVTGSLLFLFKLSTSMFFFFVTASVVFFSFTTLQTLTSCLAVSTSPYRCCLPTDDLKSFIDITILVAVITGLRTLGSPNRFDSFYLWRKINVLDFEWFFTFLIVQNILCLNVYTLTCHLMLK